MYKSNGGQYGPAWGSLSNWSEQRKILHWFGPAPNQPHHTDGDDDDDDDEEEEEDDDDYNSCADDNRQESLHVKNMTKNKLGFFFPEERR